MTKLFEELDFYREKLDKALKDGTLKEVFDIRDQVESVEQKIIFARKENSPRFSSPETEKVYNFFKMYDFFGGSSEEKIMHESLTEDFEVVCKSPSLSGPYKVRTAELIQSLFWEAIDSINFDEVAKALKLK